MKPLLPFLRRHTLPLLIAAALLGTTAVAVVAQPFLANFARLVDAVSGSAPSVTATGTDANISLLLQAKGTGTVSVINQTPVVERLFLDAASSCRSDNASLVVVRIAQSDWALARTAGGAETYNITCAIPLGLQTTALRGARVDSFSLVYQVTTAALTSSTFQALATVSYVNNVANAINATYGGAVTITMPTATQANPYVIAGTLASPAFQNVPASDIVIDFQVVMQNTGVFRFYGILVNYTTVAS